MSVLVTILASLPVLWVLYILYPVLRTKWCAETNVKQRYDAEWALVTGATGGIGQEICTTLAKQGMNLIITSPTAENLSRLREKLQSSYEIVVETIAADLSLGANHAPPQFIQDLKDRTAALDVRVMFLNAGYAHVESLLTPSAVDQVKNLHTNAIINVYLAEWMMQRMAKAGARGGAIVATSSCVSFVPTPAAPMYGPSKALLAAFMDSIKPEASLLGVDLLTVHPGPVRTAFFDNIAKTPAIRMMVQCGSTAESVVKSMFQSIGHVSHRDITVIGVLCHLFAAVVGSPGVGWIADRVLFKVASSEYKRYFRGPLQAAEEARKRV